jgi:excisionase family DNA binding protein
MSTSQLLTVDDFCREFNVSRPTLYRLAARGEIPLVKIGRATRIRRADAEAWAGSLPTRAA